MRKLLPKAEEMIGNTYERLTVLGIDRQEGYFTYMKCRCSCGTEKTIERLPILQGRVVSCGCFARERARERAINILQSKEIRQKAHKAAGDANRTHGMKNTPEYRTWSHLKARCYNKNDKSYPRYGAKGIRVCERWLESFENFYQDLGPRPGPEYSIDRIDSKGPYSPDNCRWATQKTQANNKSDNVNITFNNKTQTLAQWAEELGFTYSTLQHRLYRGWSIEKMLTTPMRKAPKGSKRAALEIDA